MIRSTMPLETSTLVLALALLAAPAAAEIAVVSNDGHTVTVNGVQ